jgi:hypothetical protein
VHVITSYGEGGVRLCSFFSSSLDGDEFSALPSCRFTPGKRATVPIQQEDLWAPEPVWEFWKKYPAGNLTTLQHTGHINTYYMIYHLFDLHFK